MSEMALRQNKELDEGAAHLPSEKIADMIWASDVSWLTAHTALQQALCTVMLNVACPHCRRLFVENGYMITMQSLLNEIRESIEEDERVKH
jgi:hypothetical protein